MEHRGGVVFVLMISLSKGVFTISKGDSLDATVNRFEREYARMLQVQQSADWAYRTNVTDATGTALRLAADARDAWRRPWALWARALPYPPPQHLSPQLQAIASGIVYMDDAQARQVNRLKEHLSAIYSAAGERRAMASMRGRRHPAALLAAWKAWRRATGEPARAPYLHLVHITNRAARQNGYRDLGEAWREGEDSGALLRLWKEVESLYRELHAYARHKLEKFFGEEHFPSPHLIPAHLLGSIWSEDWSSLYDLLQPFPGANETTHRGSPLDVIRLAESIYSALGMEPLPNDFWTKSMFEEPGDGRVVDCHSAAYDFADGRDFRVRMCLGEEETEGLAEAVHELGHVHYAMAYRGRPPLQRRAPHPALHEAIGDALSHCPLSSLLPTPEWTLNTLMKQALSKVALLPWAMALETWRHQLFATHIVDESIIDRWWELRKSFQGVEPPDEESSRMFDPGSKYHVIMHIPYIRYFESRFVEHQLLESLCGGQPTQSCCPVHSDGAGERLRSVLSLGGSVSWPDALEALTGSRRISAGPLMRHFAPLHHFLRNYNAKHNVTALTHWE